MKPKYIEALRALIDEFAELELYVTLGSDTRKRLCEADDVVKHLEEEAKRKKERR